MEFLNDIVYANFSQLSYFDWHKFDKSLINFENKKFVKGPTVSEIFDNIVNYSSILTPRYTNGKRIKKIGNDYVSHQEKDHATGQIVNIYDYDDYLKKHMAVQELLFYLTEKVFFVVRIELPE